VLGDWLAAGYNFFAGVWTVAGGPNQVEFTVLEWFRQWIGMPEGAGGLLTSGGSAANLTAVVAARHAVVGEDASRLPRLTVYVSDQAHSSTVRAAWIAGVPRAHVRVLPADDAYRLRPDLLADAIRRDRAAGLLPLMVVASAGTTNTGAVDPLDDLADLCTAEGVWLHVDGAFGGFAAMTERGRAQLAGLGRADSVTLDPHKWLFVPFECGSLLVRDPHKLGDAFRILPDYLRDVEARTGEVNFADYGEQLTRSARALKVWLSISYFGAAAYRGAIDGGIDRAVLAERLVRARPELEVLSPATLAVLCFRGRGPAGATAGAVDVFNERILAAVNAGGRHFISSTRIRGAFALRICPIGHRTADDDVRALVEEIATLAAEQASSVGASAG
jgi:glutamate/tyrosine decarboxylase-like PLP-dependent enzyme